LSLSSGGGNKKRGAGERQIPPGSTSFQAQGNRPIIFPCEGAGDREGRDSRADRHRLIKTLLYLKSDKRERDERTESLLYNDTEPRGPGGDNGRLPGKGHTLSASAL